MKDFINFIKDFLLGFLLTWYALDLWKLFHGDICPLWRKGVDVEWLVNTKKDEQTHFFFTDTASTETYTYSEPVLLKPED